MEARRISSHPFFASFTLGLKIRFPQQILDKSAVITYLQTYQNQLIKEKNIKLSACVTECSIVLSGQDEPHLKFGFINYPRFPEDTKVLKLEVEKLARYMKEVCEQNRVVIEFDDETVMYEMSDEIDPDIL